MKTKACQVNQPASLGSCSICPSCVFHSATENLIHFSIFHHDYIEQSTNRIKTEHRFKLKTTTSEYNLNYPSLKKFQAHRRLKNHR